jgi:hypothetical protein
MMKYFLFLLIFVSSESSAFSQDSLFIISHYSIAGIQDECRGSSNELQCLENFTERTQQETHSGNNYRYVFEKKKKALLVYQINAGWIQRKRGNYAKSNEHFNLLNLYIDSLKTWEAFRRDIEDIVMFHTVANKRWCFDTYQADSAAFYTCNCDTLFPELKQNQESDTLINSSQERKIDVLYGKLTQSNMLRLAPQFKVDQKSIEYLEKHQNRILSELKRIGFHDLMRELSSSLPTQDTLILRIEISSDAIELIKRCTIVKQCNVPLAGQFYRNAIMQMDLPIPSENVVFFVPMVFEMIDYSSCCDLDTISVGSDHFLFQYEAPNPAETHE